MMKRKVGLLVLLFGFVSLLAACSEDASKEGVGEMQIGIGRDEDMEVSDVTDTFNVDDLIAVTYEHDEAIGGSVTFIILEKVGKNEEIYYQWDEPLDPTWTWFSLEIYSPEYEGEFILRLAKDDELLAEKEFTVE
ncbi:hypothetical protein LC085_10845 [Bacillus tianshenii]|uniref:hypothetical protein n=1 Tax=Sutcliffiella tianshenii TaxID=1463404 RepID=UPI001CD359F2|nr:hypothetical protein [Bacillus tianshenii]MCA1320407.1 hypothetical protein [Bacillus tianshenii]